MFEFLVIAVENADIVNSVKEAVEQEVNKDVFWQFVKYATPIVVALSGAVTVLWKAVYKQMNDTQTQLIESKTELTAKLDQCEEKHHEQNLWAVAMSEKVGKLEGMMEGHNQAREDLKELSNNVIALLKKDE